MTDKAAPNIIDFFSGRPLSEIKQEKIIRISPEYDGLSMLYSNENNPDRYFAMRILFWGLRLNGDVVGFVPWLDSVVACPDIIDPLNGQFEGYYDPAIDNIFYDAPIHKVVELETSHVYFESHFDAPETGEVNEDQSEVLVQELPDTIGTHALLIGEDRKTLTLTEVISWRLYRDGHIAGTLVDPDKIGHTPILPGDLSLYDATNNPTFRFYFQHHIANQIKDDNPDALEAIAMLLDESAKKNNEVSVLDDVDEDDQS
ncbi:MAG: hypothetical protein HRU21_05415 [Pseudomonadales bacterium]|nr:hypothetical protein [Pseudomonadales bacterium]